MAANGNELFYHTIMNKNSKHNYEIDFILARKNKIIPIEVKFCAPVYMVLFFIKFNETKSLCDGL